ncbi:Spy/CpxP family protein refolding chaperone [Acidocella sp.]|uniref:Spy/CpxP family protein refolding chaperone n=1 Tax=Acidocella sp. TaxID=50710 RepID=UPI00262759C5|nr:Spy/CpxP family protein refolding chaperone [Acidocella sp.]MDD2795935.1 Spy/CpxP family protein refolding chaperone [Acidocella sp.]
MRPLSGLAVFASAVLLFGGLAAYSAAQTTPDQAAPTANYGPGMMNGWAPGGWGHGIGKTGPGGPGRVDVFDSLKQALNITAAQGAAWDAYTTAVTTADHTMWTGMRALWQNNTTAAKDPDARFNLMRQMIDLRKQDFDAQQAAAKALLPHLSAYQSGQASEILPGLAEAGRGGCGRGIGRDGWGPGMMMGFGGPPL